MNHSHPTGAVGRSFLIAAAFVLCALSVTFSSAARAGDDDRYWGKPPQQFFRWVSTFDVIAGNGSAVAEIIDATKNGKQLIYTDADNEQIGFVDVRNIRYPLGLGTLDLPGEPTSLAILDPLVLVAVNTSESFTNPSGQLLVIHINKREIIERFDLGGQPDSIAIAPDQKRAVVVIENERDEEICVGGGLNGAPAPEDDDDAIEACEAAGGVVGGMPQTSVNNPTGEVLILDMKGAVRKWKLRAADLTSIAANAFAGSDLEPEFVDINHRNLAVVSFQENNHYGVIDIVSGHTVSEFSAGSAALHNVDTVEDDLIILDQDISKRREPDAVAWLDGWRFASANEGDYTDGDGEEGGSRGFTIFSKGGRVLYESAESFEHLLVSAGHYNEGRSENKGVEPESAESGRYRGRNLLFIGSERSNAVGVYEAGWGKPRLLQALPTGIGPEGIKAVPKRNLLVVSTESDEEDAGIPTMINLYRYGTAKPRYPQIASGPDSEGLPIGWVALSGLVGDPWDRRTLYAVSDSFLAKGFIYKVDVSRKPALIVDRLEVDTGDATPDLEGIAVGPDGYFWLASEGRADGSRPNAILKVDPYDGTVVDQIELPPGLAASTRNNGFEGIAVTGHPGEEVVYVAIQRAWFDGVDTDKVNTKIGRYDVGSGEWGFVHYPLEPEGKGGWIGLSELTLLPDGTFAVIERDKGWGPTTTFIAELKAIFQVDLEHAPFRAFDDPDGLVTIDKTYLRNLNPLIERKSIFTAEKLEGLAVSANGRVYAVTDNDGVDDAPGETIFLRLGRIERAFPRH